MRKLSDQMVNYGLCEIMHLACKNSLNDGKTRKSNPVKNKFLDITKKQAQRGITIQWLEMDGSIITRCDTKRNLDMNITPLSVHNNTTS